jgi:4-hydroxy-4-methyl-2-oxoglutarate aldolase
MNDPAGDPGGDRAGDPADDRAARLLALGSATLGEAGGTPMHPRIKAAWPGAEMAGTAFPVTCGEADNLAIHVGVASAPAGSVLVVDAHHPGDRGYWGEVLATAAESRGISGLVIDGGVRDVAALEAHQFAVFSTMVALRGTVKVSGGSVGGSTFVGEVEVGEGDWVVGDADGVTVVARERVDVVLAAAQARADKEQAMFARLRAGATTLELLGLDPSGVDRR